MSCDSSFNQVIVANTKFAASLYREICKRNTDGNVFISPLSLSTVLAMTLVGSRENTEIEMIKTLCMDNIDKELLHTSFKNILSTLTGIVNVANRIFLQEGFSVLQSFIEVLENNYRSGCTSVNFSEAAAVDVVNDWANKETNGKIPKFLGTLDDNTMMIIANAIYFKSLWETQFKVDNTRVAPFRTAAQESIKVNMMYQNSKFRLAFHEDTNSHVLELPHNNGKTSMLIFLPSQIDGLPQLENKFGPTFLEDLLPLLSLQKTKVWLPSFKLEESYALKSVLASLGMNDLFSSSTANLSGISVTNNLFATEVVHKSFIVVNEEGTEAAAVSGVILKKRSLQLETEFRADHPFMFCILERESKNILFLGRLVKPDPVSLSHEEL